MPRVDGPLLTRHRRKVLSSLVLDGPSDAYRLAEKTGLSLSTVQSALKALVNLGNVLHSHHLDRRALRGREFRKVHGPTLRGLALILTGTRLDPSEIRKAAEHYDTETDERTSMIPAQHYDEIKNTIKTDEITSMTWPTSQILFLLLGKWNHFRTHDVEDCALKLLRLTNPEEVQAQGLLNTFYKFAEVRLSPWELQRWNKMLAADKDLRGLAEPERRQIREWEEKMMQLQTENAELRRNQEIMMKMSSNLHIKKVD
jgi:hypothetical protein